MASRLVSRSMPSSARGFRPSLISKSRTNITRLFASQPPARPAAHPSSKSSQLPLRSRGSSPSSSPSPHPNRTRQSVPELLAERKWAFYGAGVVALIFGAYISNLIVSGRKKHSSLCSCSTKIPVDPFTLSADSHDHHQPQEKGDEEKQPVPPTGLPPTINDVPCAITTTPTDYSPARADAEARAFDRSLAWDEWLMGITGLREHLASLARGHVLEVAVGTGRNLEYLDWSGVVAAARGENPSSTSSSSSWFSWFGSNNDKNDEAQRGVQSYTGIDVSGAMLGVARDRVRENVPGLSKVMRRKRAEPMPRLADLPSPEDREVVVDALDGRVRLILGDALRGLPPPPSSTTKPQDQQQPAADGKYDTILQTFGLCSVPNPPALLAQMARHVRPETGRIYLLEHGRGTWSWINKRLDKDAADHFSKFGCWWNRDIEGIVRETAKQVPGLEVVKVVRPLWLQFGSVLVVELKVRG